MTPPLVQANRRKDFSRVAKNLEKTMKRRMLATITHAIMAIAITLAVMPATAAAQDQAPDRSLVGVWIVKITPRNCATGDPIPAGTFEALFTFHEDKTMLVSLRNSSLTVDRTAAHGLWRRDAGWSDYSFKFMHIRVNVATGTFNAFQENAATLVLGESGDEFTTVGTGKSFDVDGNTLGTSSCSNSVGTRLKLEM
jgi:hypothetical protein